MQTADVPGQMARASVDLEAEGPEGGGAEADGALAIGADRAGAVSEVLAGIVADVPRLTPVELGRITTRIAAERSLWEDIVVHDPDARWYTVVHRATGFDVWLLSWTPSQDTDWHDHGGSSGSFAVADGVLEERYRRGAWGRTARRLLAAGQAASFGPAHVHNVSHDAAVSAPATSIHAYSPPLVAMTYYDLTPTGLVARATVAVEGPEGSRGRGTPAASSAAVSSVERLAEALPAGQGIDELLSEARRSLARLRPEAAAATLTDKAVLVDIRPLEERIAEGVVPGALVIGRNVLEWRLDPRSDARIAGVASFDTRVIVMCQEGYVSSLAAASLRRIGLDACDLDGGYRAWKAAGLPTAPVRLGS